MTDLIRREDAINKLYNINPSEDFLFIDAIVDMLENLPAIKTIEALNEFPPAESERTAKVETVEKPNVFKCGECGQYFHSTAWGSPVEYCSRCGAKLDWGKK